MVENGAVGRRVGEGQSPQDCRGGGGRGYFNHRRPARCGVIEVRAVDRDSFVVFDRHTLFRRMQIPRVDGKLLGDSEGAASGVKVNRSADEIGAEIDCIAGCRGRDCFAQRGDSVCRRNDVKQRRHRMDGEELSRFEGFEP